MGIADCKIIDINSGTLNPKVFTESVLHLQGYPKESIEMFVNNAILQQNYRNYMSFQENSIFTEEAMKTILKLDKKKVIKNDPQFYAVLSYKNYCFLL
jgi:hypothetical protein